MFRLFLTITIFVACVADPSKYEYEDGVAMLKTSNFHQAVSENKYVLVEFYSDWCFHCISLAEKWIKIAKTLKEEESPVLVSKVNGGNEKELIGKLKISGYPTILLLKKQTVWEYDGDRTEADILNWVRKKSGPASRTLTTTESAKKFIDGNDVAVIGYFLNADSEETKAYVSIADELDNAPFTHCFDKAIAQSLQIPENKLKVFKKNDDDATHTGDVKDHDNLKGWLLNHTWILVQELNEQSAQRIFGGTVYVHCLLFVNKEEENHVETLKSFKKAASEFKGKVLFIFVDVSNMDNDRVMEYFNIAPKKCPVYYVVRMDEDMAKYKPPSAEITAEGIIAFTNKVLQGGVQRHRNAEPLPDDWNKHPVYTLVASNFRQVVFDPKRKVFVQFHAPWCAECKKINAAWEELGKKYAENDTVVIAKMDATANEVDDPSAQVASFPAFRLFLDDHAENMVEYNGDRTVEAMMKFIDTDGMEVVPRSEDPDFPSLDDLFKEEEEVIDAGTLSEDLKKLNDKLQSASAEVNKGESDTGKDKEGATAAAKEGQEKTPEEKEKAAAMRAKLEELKKEHEKQGEIFKQQMAELAAKAESGELMEELKKILPNASAGIPGFKMPKIMEEEEGKDEL